MKNIQESPDVGMGESPKDQFIDVMHDAASAVESRNSTELRFALDHARAIADVLDEADQKDAMSQIDKYEEEFGKLSA